MTIAACFRFDEGILFCADTKITRDIKTTQTKIFDHVYGGESEPGYCATVFVLTGVVPYAKSAIEHCEGGLGHLDFLKASIQDVRDEIESALVDFYQKHVYSNPNPDNADFQLLVGVWLRGETYVFSSFGTTLNPVRDYECLGTGAYLALYWVRQFLASRDREESEDCTLDDVALISAYALKSVMEYDEYCGGQAEFIIMRKNGLFSHEVDTAIPLYPCEEFPDKILKAMWKMMRKITSAENKRDVELATADFHDAVAKIVEKRSQWIDQLAFLLKDSMVKPKPDGT
jgi:20S proteasome alpha/beta subunit